MNHETSAIIRAKQATVMHGLTRLFLSVAILLSAPSVLAAPETYIHLTIGNRSQIQELTKLVDIADVQGTDVWAFATNPMLTRLRALGYGWDVLPYPGRDEKIKMARNVDEITKTWQSFPTYDQYVELMNAFANQHSDICRLVEFGQSQLGRKLLALKITNHPDRVEDEPEVFYTSTMHGNEPTGYMLMLRVADQILSGYGSEPWLTALVDNLELWINPLANPDGTYAGGDQTIKYATRSLFNGVNANRNFPSITGDSHPDGNPWAPETVAMMNFAALHHFTLSANFHSGSEVVNYPWDTTPDRHPEQPWFIALARAYATEAQLDGPNKYMTAHENGITDGYDWFQASGTRQDYMTYYHSDHEVTVELAYKYLVNANEIDTYWQANRNALLGYLETALTGVRGVVTGPNGKPLEATVEVQEIPNVGALVTTDPAVGDYHRMLLPGIYTLRFAAKGFRTSEMRVTVQAGLATRLDVRMQR